MRIWTGPSHEQSRAGGLVALPPGLPLYALVVAAAILVVAQPFGLDVLQLLIVGAAVVASLFVLRRRSTSSKQGEATASELHHKAIWLALIFALTFSCLQNYAEYLALLDRLGQLHGDVIAQTGSVGDQLLAARTEAQTLDSDLSEWISASEGARPALESRIASVLASLKGRTQYARTHLQAVVDRLNPTTASAAQPVVALNPSTLASIRNLADDSVQETNAMVLTLQAVEQAWSADRTAPGAREQLQYTVNPRLWNAIDSASNAASQLGHALPKATTVPVADLFVVITVLNLTTALFPWLLLLLFISGRRDVRLRQIYLDLWDLGGKTRDLLERVMDRVDENLLDRDGYKNDDVRHALEERTFSDVEYLLCLGVLTILLTAGWHMVLYPTGALGLEQLVVSGVSVRDFAMYVVGNLNVITLGFLGAYFYSTGVLIRRYFASDLYPSAFLQMIHRLIAVFVISLVLTILVPIALVGDAQIKLMTTFIGLPAAPGGGVPLDGTTALAGALAFVFGIWTSAFIRWLPRLIGAIPKLGTVLSEPQASVAALEGVDLWVEGRLDEEGIETVQAMATAAIERLVRRTYFSTQRIVNWVDQAVLFMHAGNDGQWMPAFRAAGIHTATDLLDAIGYEEARTPGTPVDLASVQRAVDTLVRAAASETDANKTALTAETVFAVCCSLWHEPNLRYVLSYYDAHRVESVRARALNGALNSAIGLRAAARTLNPVR